MKKRIINFVLALVLALSMAGTAFASTGGGTSGPTIENLGTGVTAELAENGKAVQLTVSGLTTGQQYLVLMVSGIYTDVTKVQITESTIRYIDQQADTNGSVSFKVYPSSMQSSTILLSGGNEGLRIVATVSVPYITGDANGDGDVTAADGSTIAKHCVWIIELQGDRFLAADVTHDGDVTAADKSKIAKYLVFKIDSLD